MKFLNHNLFTGDITVNGTTTLSTATGITRTTGDNTTHLATTAFVKAQDYATNTSLGNYVPVSRTLTINGVTLDLSANRSFTVASSGVSGTTNFVSKFTDGTTLGNSQIFDNGTNVGIGTTSPDFKLDISGVTRFQDIVRFKTNAWNLSDDGHSRFYFGHNARTYFGSQDGYEWRSAGDTALAVITNAGNVGIGTTAPGQKLDVVGASQVDAYIRVIGGAGATKGGLIFGNNDNSKEYGSLFFDNSNNNVYLFQQYNAGSLIFGTNTIEKMRITSTGNVLIGTTADTPLSTARGIVINSGASNDAQIRLQNNGTGSTGSDGALFSLSGTAMYLWNYENDALLFGTNNTERIRILSGGNVGIGTTSPGSKLTVAGNIALTGTSAVFLDGTSGWSAPMLGRDGTNIFLSDFSGVQLGGWNGSSYGARMTVQGTGNVGIGTTSPQTKLQVVGAAVQVEGLLNISNTYASGGVYFPAAKIRNTRGDHSYGIVAEFSMGAVSGADRPSILFYADASAHSWNLGQVTAGTGLVDSFAIGYRANNLPSTFNAFAANYFQITPAGNVQIGTTTDSGFKLDVSGTARVGALTGTSATFSGSVTAMSALLQSANTNSVVDIFALYNPSQTSSGVRQKFANGYGDLAAIKVSQINNGAGADNGQIEFQTATDAVLSTKLTILDTGAATFSSTISSGGNINVGGQLTFTPNDARLISGSSTFAINNNANNLNLLIVHNSTGNVGIGTSIDSGFKLDVNGTGRFSGGGSVPLSLVGTAFSGIEYTRGAILFGFIGTEDTSSGGMRYNSIAGNFEHKFYNNSILSLTIASTGAATFSSSVSVGSRLALQPSNFGYHSSYKTLLIGSAGTDYTTNAVSLAFNVDISGNPSGSFNGSGQEYIWRNAGVFITPNAANTSYNTLFGWNSSGQVTFNQATTLSSSLTVERIQINSTTYEPLAINSSYGQVGLKFGLNGNYFAAIGSANNVTGAYAGSETDLGLGTYGSATASITFVTGTSLGRRMTITSAGEVLINRTGASGLGKLNVDGGADFTGGNVLMCRDTGNVGIGTASPLNLLHVSQASANTIFRLGNNAAHDQFIYFNGNNDWSLGMDYSNSNAFVLSNNSSLGTNDRLVVTTGGNVGIGTTNPGAKLDVVGSVRISIIDNGAGDFATISGAGVITRRTAAQVLSDIGAQPASTAITTSNIGSQSVSFATSATQVVTLQDNPPAGLNGKLWWETDTGILKVYYGAASAWIDALPMPDVTLFYPKAGGAITGDVSIQQSLTVSGNILTSGTVTATGGNSTQWNTAFGWGNHASAGYLTSLPAHNHDDRYYTESESDSRFVNATGDSMTGDLILSGYANPHITLTTTTGGEYSYLELYDGSSYGYIIKNKTSSTANNVLPGSLYLYTDSSKATQIVHNGTSNAAFLSGGDVYIRGQVYVGGNGASTGTQLVYNSGTWGINVTGNAGTATTATNLIGLGSIQSTSTGTSYQNNYQVRENSGGGGNTNEIYAPQLAFHWSGVVASSIMMESSGRIAIRNNPGGSYESFIANNITASGNIAAANFSGSSSGTNTGDQTNISGNAATATTAGALTSMNISQFTNNSGYITGYTETDTLGTVTNRGNSTSQNIVFSNGRKGLVGVYDAAQTQAVFAMGPAYMLTDGGASNNIGNLYGLAWSYNPNYAGAGNNPQSKAGLEHQLLLMNNGVTLTALGAGIWTSGLITTTSYGTSSNWNTAYGWGNHASAGYITGNQTITLSGDVSGSGTTSIVVTVNNIDGWGFVNTGSNSAINADTINSNGISYYDSGVTNFSGNATDGALYSQRYSDSWQHQIAGDYRSGMIAVRGKNNGTWTSWKTIIDSSTIGSQSVSYATSAGNADTVDGFHETAFFRDNQDRTLGVLRFTGVGGDSGNANHSYAIYQGGGAWGSPFPDLHIGYHTGIKLGAHTGYGGIRFYSDSDMATQLFSVGNGDNHVRVLNNLYVTGTISASNLSGTNTGDQTNISGNAATATTAGSITNQANSATITASTSAIANTIVLRDGAADIYSRYSFSSYVNTTDNDESSITRFIIKNGDNYHRSATTTVAANIIRGVASGDWGINVTGNADTVDGKHGTNNAGNLAVYEANGYLYIPSWMNVNGGGIFSGTNNAHLRPNSGSYGAWEMIGSKNGWSGIFFSDSGDHLMANSNEVGHYQNGIGWKFRWYQGEMYISSGTTGGGTERTVIHSGNIGSQSVSFATSATVVVTIQDNPPAGVNGKLWWESDTGKLKVYYGTASAWIDATPVPDTSLFYAKAGGPISGSVSIQQTLTVTGNTLIQGTLTETSDISLKENILPLESSLDKVMKLNGVSFNKKATPNVKEIGFIAQEVEAVIPELVSETDEGIKTVSYSRVTAVLVETIKEQQAQIEELKNMVNLLAEKLNNL